MDDAKRVALLAAKIAADHPTLPHALRDSAARVCQCADRLEAELRTYSPLEAILETAIHCVGARTGRPVDEETLMLLLDRFGVNDAGWRSSASGTWTWTHWRPHRDRVV